MPETMSKQRLRWACRRGMLELDLILEPYVVKYFDSASPSTQRQFIKMLECSDQDLFDWFLKKKVPTDPEIAEIINTVLEHVCPKL